MHRPVRFQFRPIATRGGIRGRFRLFSSSPPTTSYPRSPLAGSFSLFTTLRLGRTFHIYDTTRSLCWLAALHAFVSPPAGGTSATFPGQVWCWTPVGRHLLRTMLIQRAWSILSKSQCEAVAPPRQVQPAARRPPRPSQARPTRTHLPPRVQRALRLRWLVRNRLRQWPPQHPRRL